MAISSLKFHKQKKLSKSSGARSLNIVEVRAKWKNWAAIRANDREQEHGHKRQLDLDLDNKQQRANENKK